MTDPLVEAVARAIDNEMPGHGYGERAARAAIAAIREAAWAWIEQERARRHDRVVNGGAHDEGYIDGAEDLWLHLRTVAGIREAEPLTSTPEPSTTETGPKANIPEQCGCASGYCSMCREDARHQDSPPGFEWEYRAVEQMEDTMNGGWYDPNGWGWTSEHDAHTDASLIEGACVKERVRVWLERRLVGKPERMGEEP